jgi:hypothetical protein
MGQLINEKKLMDIKIDELHREFEEIMAFI